LPEDGWLWHAFPVGGAKRAEALPAKITKQTHGAKVTKRTHRGSSAKRTHSPAAGTPDLDPEL
jgi:hypothetical protein